MFIQKMTVNEIYAIVYKRYKDDINFILEALGDESDTQVGEERNHEENEGNGGKRT